MEISSSILANKLIFSHRSMEQRHKAMEEFRQGQWQILVATDVVARGLNLPKVKYVVGYLPIQLRVSRNHCT
jgi:ATP-dependent RNA helicase RhlE